MAGETAGGVLLPVCVVRAGVGTTVMVLSFLGGMAVVLLRRKINGCQNKRDLIGTANASLRNQNFTTLTSLNGSSHGDRAHRVGKLEAFKNMPSQR